MNGWTLTRVWQVDHKLVVTKTQMATANNNIITEQIVRQCVKSRAEE